MAALLAGGCPDTLALETAIGPTSRSSSSATGCNGIRSITVPLVWPRSHASDGACGNTSDSPPGQNASMRSRAARGTLSTSPSIVDQEPTSTGTGMSGPRCFAARRPRTASALNASQPSPYTVSVGSTTSRAREPRAPPRPGPPRGRPDQSSRTSSPRRADYDARTLPTRARLPGRTQCGTRCGTPSRRVENANRRVEKADSPGEGG